MSLRARLRLLWTAGRGVVRGLPEAQEHFDPIELFRAWWDGAERSGLLLPESCALATATAEGAPSVRMVLLKGLDERGFVFFTNYESRKAKELDANPQASLCFHWRVLQRQVRVEGSTHRISPEESAAYFRTRSRGSRLGAWASRQSEVLRDLPELKESFRRAEEEHRGGDVPLPHFWGGYRLEPRVIEFWQGRADRLHDRLVFERDGAEWKTHRLYP